jgi:hypothetical protein
MDVKHPPPRYKSQVQKITKKKRFFIKKITKNEKGLKK